MRILLVVLALIALGSVTSRAQAFGSCAEDGYLDFFLSGTPPQACDEIHTTVIRAATGLAKVRVIALASDPRDASPTWIAPLEAAAVAIGGAMDAMATPRLPDEITILLSSAERSVGGVSDHAVALAHARGYRPGQECSILFYKQDSEVSADEFVFALAHEVFHCVQYETWPVPSRGRDSEANWWVEGSAEYFAHLANPGSGQGAGWYQSFDNRSVRESLLALEYENVVFFDWIANEGGPPAVAAFLDQMRTGDQLSVLRRVMPLADWSRFAEAWLDGQVTTPGGDAITPQPNISAEGTMDGPISLPMTVAPYVIARWDLTFVRNKRFDLVYQVTGGTMQTGMKEVGAGVGWPPPPEQINTCDEAKRYILYFTTTDGPASATLDIDTDPDTTGGTCCLIGVWKPTPEALSGQAQFALAGGAADIAAVGGTMSCSYLSGSWALTFGETGSGNISYSDYANSCTSAMPDGEIKVVNNLSGSTDFEWDVTGEGAAILTYTDHSMSQSLVLSLGPIVRELGGAYPGPAAEANGMAFTCTRETLSAVGMFNLFHTQAEHTRVTPP